MVKNPLVSRKRERDRKGTSRGTTNKLALPWRSPKLDPSLKLSASTAKEMVTVSWTAPNIWRIRRMAKWTNVYLTYMLSMRTLLVLVVAPGYLIHVRLLRLVTWNRSCRINTSRGWSDDVCWKLFQDWYDHHRTLPILSGLVLNLNKCYLVFALSMNKIGSCLLQYGYSFQTE